MVSTLMADVSSNNAHPNFREYKRTGHLIIAIKASEGTHYVNPFHHGWCLEAGMNHIAVVHYHFARPDLNDNPVNEAVHFLDAVGHLAGHWDYLCLDMERGLGGSFARDPIWARAFDQYIQKHTRFHTVLYASRSVLEISDEWLTGDRKRVWDADYSTHADFVPRGYDFFARQFTDGIVGPEPHSLAGVGRCDVNRVSWDVLRRLEHRR